MATWTQKPETHNRPDEWKIEQGINGAKLPFLDQTGPETLWVQPASIPEHKKDEAAVAAVGNKDELFKMELPGWKGFVSEIVRTSSPH
jgi:sulfite oxidase